MLRLMLQEKLGSKKIIDDNRPLRIDVVAVMERPKRLSTLRKDGTLSGGHPRSRIPATSKPDCDNIEKLVLDALNPFIFDDAQVFWATTSKYWAALGEGPSLRVVVIGSGAGRVDAGKNSPGGLDNSGRLS